MHFQHSTVAGSGGTHCADGDYADGPGEVAQFDHPTGIAVDKAGNLYVADKDNHRIRKIDITQQ